MLYDSAARADEALGLDVGDLDLANRQARARTKGGHVRPLRFLRYTGRKPGALRPTGHCTLRAVRPGGPPEDTVPAGRVGELLAGTGGGTAFSGYPGRPGATAAAMAGGWYRTGDLAVFDSDGDFRRVTSRLTPTV